METSNNSQSQVTYANNMTFAAFCNELGAKSAISGKTKGKGTNKMNFYSDAKSTQFIDCTYITDDAKQAFAEKRFDDLQYVEINDVPTICMVGSKDAIVAETTVVFDF